MPEKRSAEFCRGALWGMERYRNDREKGFLEIRGEFRVRLAEAEAREAKALDTGWDDPDVQFVYRLMGASELPGPVEEHWEGKVARMVVAHFREREASMPTAANGTGTLTLSETIAGLREACAGVTVSTVVEPTEADLAVADELDMLSAHIQEYIGPDDARDDIRRICRNRAEDLRRGVERGPSAAEVIAAAEKALEAIQFECDGKADCDDSADGIANRPNLAMRCEMAAEPALALIAKWKEVQ